jgi:acyl-CoA synthetase (AMP-forming)/AMP-acid ligase II
VPGPDLSMGSTLARNATWFADTPAYVADGCTRSHAQLYARAARLASALAASGVRRQDRVSLLGRNSIEFGEVLAAGQLSGIIVATVNFRLAGPGRGRRAVRSQDQAEITTSAVVIVARNRSV